MICGGPHLRCEPLPARFEIDGDWGQNLSLCIVAAEIVLVREAIHRELLKVLKTARG